MLNAGEDSRITDARQLFSKWWGNPVLLIRLRAWSAAHRLFPIQNSLHRTGSYAARIPLACENCRLHNRVEIAKRGRRHYDFADVIPNNRDLACTHSVAERNFELRAFEQRMGRKRWGLARSDAQVLSDDPARANLGRDVQRGHAVEMNE